MGRKVSFFTIVGMVTLATGCDARPTTVDSLGPSAAVAQQPGAAPDAQADRGPGARTPIARMLRMREQLGLTETQVGQLESILADLETKNQPLVEQVRAALPEPPFDRAELRALTPEERRARMEEMREQMRANRDERRAQMEQLRPVLDQIQANQEAAITQARSVLTSEQLEMVRTRIADQRREARRPGFGPGRGGPGRRLFDAPRPGV